MSEKTPGQAAEPVAVGAQLAAALDERNSLRALVAEILDAHHTVVSAEQVQIWRQRAGLDTAEAGGKP